MRKLLFKCLVLSVVFTMVGCSDELSVLSNPKQSSVETVGQEEICVDQSKALEAFSNLKDFYGLNTRSVQDDNKPIFFLIIMVDLILTEINLLYILKGEQKIYHQY